MSYPVPHVYGHIAQLEGFHETDDRKVQNALTAFAGECKTQKFERTFLFDLSRDFAAQKVRVNRISPDILVGLHRHDYYEFNYVLKGALYEYVDGTVTRLEKNGFALFPPTVFHSVYPVPGSTCFNILIDKAYFEALREKYRVCFDSNVLNYVCERQRAVLMNAAERSEIHIAAAELYRQHFRTPEYPVNSLPFELLHSRFTVFLLCLLSAEQRGKLCTDIRPSAADGDGTDKVDRMIAYIRDNYQTITLSGLSKKFGYSASQIHRLLIKYTGLRLSDLIDQNRYNHSLALLRETDLPLEKISQAVGLEKTSFCRFFKRVGYCTPLQFRKGGNVAVEEAMRKKLHSDS